MPLIVQYYSPGECTYKPLELITSRLSVENSRIWKRNTIIVTKYCNKYNIILGNTYASVEDEVNINQNQEQSKNPMDRLVWDNLEY